MATQETAERQRLDEHSAAWRRWGPYVSDRAWGTVREDYSASGDAWSYFPHDHARSRAYRWNEDGLAGLCDSSQTLCFALALWNGQDPILKERLFGLTNSEGNHGEDVKEYYYFLDSTPSYSYMRMLYKYPQAAYPYEDLVEINGSRTRDDPEYELLDTGVFEGDRYFDVFIEYAKAEPEVILIRLTATNRGPELAPLHLMPTMWFRNTWSWDVHSQRPALSAGTHAGGRPSIRAVHQDLGTYQLVCEGADTLLFTENETDARRVFGQENAPPYVKDAFHDYVIHGNQGAVNPERSGTKAAALYSRVLEPNGTIALRLTLAKSGAADPSANFDSIFEMRQAEADEFYASLQPEGVSDDERLVQRQALAGMLWSKQFYHYDVNRWLHGDPTEPAPPAARLGGRNHRWTNLYAADVISMPDAWEYPWFAAWDLAFHSLPLALVDIDDAKTKVELLLQNRYLDPDGAIPAYEWSFSNVNPPVTAFAALRVALLERQQRGRIDRSFLARVFHKLMLNFTWWVNRQDSERNNIFQGGFLGMDNIGVIDRDELPEGYLLEQADGTSWMGVFCVGMMAMALELAREAHDYEDVAAKFFQHFLYIAGALNDLGGTGVSLWDKEDEFFYDLLRLPNGSYQQMRVRTLVGITPLFAVLSLQEEAVPLFPDLRKQANEFLARRPDLGALIPLGQWHQPGSGESLLLTLVNESQLRSILKRVLDPDEFLSVHGVRSVSKAYLDHPYTLQLGNETYSIGYEPAESRTGMFGGNSNWRGPVWFPMNCLLIDALRRFHLFYGPDWKIECPTGSGGYMNLAEVADELSRRLIGIFTRGDTGNRACFGDTELFQRDPHWRDYLLFNEYFHGDTGAGLGANHQTGWTGLVANLIQQQGERAAPTSADQSQPGEGSTSNRPVGEEPM